jgi:hypothetical protein
MKIVIDVFAYFSTGSIMPYKRINVGGVSLRTFQKRLKVSTDAEERLFEEAGWNLDENNVLTVQRELFVS